MSTIILSTNIYIFLFLSYFCCYRVRVCVCIYSSFYVEKHQLWLQAYQIETLATRFGAKRIAQGATACLTLNYVHAILTGLLAKSTDAFRMIPMIGGHIALASMLIFRYRQLNPDSLASIKQYYKHIWDLFYLEYGLYTLI
jgi:hypothetical protein